jgi:hypothetical protein
VISWFQAFAFKWVNLYRCSLAFALTLCLGHILKAIFLGQLRESEVGAVTAVDSP